jgi:hypothetical protein
MKYYYKTLSPIKLGEKKLIKQTNPETDNKLDLQTKLLRNELNNVYSSFKYEEKGLITKNELIQAIVYVHRKTMNLTFMQRLQPYTKNEIRIAEIKISQYLENDLLGKVTENVYFKRKEL